VGIGVNVNNMLATAPADLQQIAVSMCELAGQEIALPVVLRSILDNLGEKLRWIVQQPDVLRSQWSRRCALEGRKVQLKLHDRTISGKCHGIDEDGALLLESDLGVERFLSGVVVNWT
jgi:BirA family biotin operon repressor/biotin-[acetyl-CoA-carboxylase] ligase